MQERWLVSTNPRERLINASIAVKQPIACRTFGQECVSGCMHLFYFAPAVWRRSIGRGRFLDGATCQIEVGGRHKSPSERLAMFLQLKVVEQNLGSSRSSFRICWQHDLR
jgi:hypothetical protein